LSTKVDNLSIKPQGPVSLLAQGTKRRTACQACTVTAAVRRQWVRILFPRLHALL
jgi:hypothetical protein